MGLGKHCPTECQDTPRPGPACAQHCPGWSRVGHVANHTLAQVLGAVHPLTPCGRCYTTSRRRLWAAPPVHAARQGDLGLRDSKAKPAPASGQGPSLPGQGPISRGQASTQRPTASKASTACKAEPQGPGRCCVGRPGQSGDPGLLLGAPGFLGSGHILPVSASNITHPPHVETLFCGFLLRTPVTELRPPPPQNLLPLKILNISPLQRCFF